MATMFYPPHPGEIIKELCLEPLNITVTEATKALGVSRKTLSELLNGHSRISPDWRPVLHATQYFDAQEILVLQIKGGI